jgi:large subunit ribosomal protein L29
MKASEITKLSLEQLAAKENELNQELFNLKFQLHTGKLENSAKISQVRKDVARIKTIYRQKKG